MIYGDIVHKRRKHLLTDVSFTNVTIAFPATILEQARQALIQGATAAVEAGSGTARSLATAAAQTAAANLIQNIPGGQHLVPAMTAAAGAATAYLVDTATRAIQETLAGATTESSTATSLAQRNPAPTPQDTTAAAAPQLTTTTDPANPTDPAIPITEFMPSGEHQASLLTGTASADDAIEEILERTVASDGWEDAWWDESEIQKLLDDLETDVRRSQKFVNWWILTHSSGVLENIQWKTNQKWIGKLVPQ